MEGAAALTTQRARWLNRMPSAGTSRRRIIILRASHANEKQGADGWLRKNAIQVMRGCVVQTGRSSASGSERSVLDKSRGS